MIPAVENSHAKEQDVQTRCVRTLGAIENLAAEWRSLFESANCRNVFLSFEWMSRWASHFGSLGMPLVIAAYSGDAGLVALAPLYVSATSRLAPRRLGFLGDKFAGSDYLDILVRTGYEREAIGGIARGVLSHRAEWDYIELEHCDSESKTMDLLRQELESLGMRAQIRPGYVCPYTELPPTFDEYLASRSPRLRERYRRAERILARRGAVEFVRIEDPRQIRGALRTIAALHKLRSEQVGRTSSFVLPAVAAFHEDVCCPLAGAGMGRVYLLRCGAETVAGLYAFTLGGRFAFYQSGFDPKWSAYSVGQILLLRTIADAIRCGYSEYDFLRGAESYKDHWADRRRETTVLALFDGRVRSRCAWMIAQSRRAWAGMKRLAGAGA